MPAAFIRMADEVLGVPKGLSRHKELFIDDILFRHGHKDSKALTNSISKMISRYGRQYSIVTGHHHECFGKATKDIPTYGFKMVWGAHSGFMGDRTHPFIDGYSNGYENQGFLIINDGAVKPIRVELDHNFKWTGRLLNAYTGREI
jgi:hypothetical protein